MTGEVKALFAYGKVTTENSEDAKELYDKSRFGSIIREGKLTLSLLETLYLLEKNKIVLLNKRNGKISSEQFIKKAQKIDPRFWVRYEVFKNFRERGYIIKTALKFGADFRIYARGVKPGEDHAKWIVYPVHESEAMTWYEFAAKNRVAHSTKKNLLMGVVDDEGDVSYWEVKWIKP